MKVFVTLLLFAAIAMANVDAQARGHPHGSVGSGKAHGSSAKIGSSNPARNVNIRAHTQNSKTRAKPAVGIKPAMKRVASKPAVKPAVGIKPAMKPVASKPVMKPTVGIKPAMKPVAPKPVMKPVAPKPVMKPVAEKKPVVTPAVNHGKPASIRDTQQKNTKPENVKPAVKPVAGKPAMKPVAEKKPVVTPSVNQGKPTSIRDNQQKNTKPENVKPAVKPVAGKPAMKPVAEKKPVVTPSVNQGKPTSIRDSQQKNTKPENVKPAVKPVAGKSAMKPVAEKKPIVNVNPIAKPAVETPGNAQNNQNIGGKPVSIQGTKDNGNFNTQVKIIDGKPVLDLQGTKKIYENKDTRVDQNGAATIRDGKKPDGYLGIKYGTKNGDSANAEVKFDDKKPSLDLQGTKKIYENKDTHVDLNGAATIRDGKKPDGYLGIKYGTKNGDSANAEVKFDDKKPSLDLQGTKKIYEITDTHVDLNGAATIRDGKKPDGYLGVKYGTENGDSANAQVKFGDGPPALILKGEKEIINNGDAPRIILKGETTLQKDKNPDLSLRIEGTKDSDSVNAGVKIADKKPIFDAGWTHKISNDISLKTGVQHQVGGETRGVVELEKTFP